MTPNADLGRVMNYYPEEQLEWFREHPDLAMRHSEWDQFWCESLQHKGFCCVSCAQDADYFGHPNFDDDCCCKAVRGRPTPSHNGRSET